MKMRLTKGKSNQLNNLSIKNLLLVTNKQFLTDWCVWISIVIGIFALILDYIFGLQINISTTLLFGPSVTALSFSFAMMSAAKILFPDEFLNYLAHDEYDKRQVNKVYVIFSPFILGSISWGVVAVVSLIGISTDMSFITGLLRTMLEVFLLILTSFSVLNLIQLMWIIIRLTIEKAFTDV